MKGQFVANQDIKAKYTYQLGGGLKGRTVKKRRDRNGNRGDE